MTSSTVLTPAGQAASQTAGSSAPSEAAATSQAIADRPILSVRHLDKSFEGVHAVNDLSFDVQPGQVVALIGPNGSGKSTTVDLISGFTPADAGQVSFDGQTISGLSAPQISDRGLARNFQNGRVFGGLSVADNIELGAHKRLRAITPLKGLSDIPLLKWLSLIAQAGQAILPGPGARREDRQNRLDVAAQVARFEERLGPRVKDQAYSLSYANRRRTEIARALISQPKLLVLDEPTAGMNQSETAEVLQQLSALKAQGQAMLLIEHKIDFVVALADQLLAVDGGKLIAQGQPSQVVADPAVIEAYLGKQSAEAAPVAATVTAESASTTVTAPAVAPTATAAVKSVVESARVKDSDGLGTVTTSAEQSSPALGQPLPAEPTAAPQAQPQPLLRLDAVDVFYGQFHALQQVSIEVPQGAIVSLLGGNASGKSTTMKTILGLKSPKAGRVLFQGDDITTASTHHRVSAGIAAVPEARRIFPAMTVYENLLTGAYSRHTSGRTRTRQLATDVAVMYERFPRLKERRSQQAGTLSGGEQQMLAFARALMSHPRLICMDEPTMGLAPIIVDEVLEQIASLRDSGLSILLVEQQAELALSIADYGYVLQNGVIRLHGAAPELLGNPAVREAYLGKG